MTELEVNQKIDEEYKSWNESVYEGDKLPSDLMVRFSKAVFSLAPSSHRASSDTLSRLINKKPQELTNYEVGFVLNQISAVPLSVLYKDVGEALKKNKEIEMLKVYYNITVKALNEEMDKKRNLLISLGTGNPVPKILPSVQA